MIKFNCTAIDLDKLMSFAHEKELPTLSSLRAARPEIRAELEILAEQIVKFNTQDESESLAKIIRTSNHLIDNNLMYYAEASKIELVVLVAMCTQKLGGDYEKSFYEALNRAFPNKL